MKPESDPNLESPDSDWKQLAPREALEQATHPVLARYHASKFPAGARILDATCGIGGDFQAISVRGNAVGLEPDPLRFRTLQARFPGHPGLHQTTVEAFESIEEFEYVWIDPARRGPQGRRLIDPQTYLPNPHLVIERCKTARLIGIKCSPLARDEDLLKLGDGRPTRIEFVSYQNECREATVWIEGRECGDLQPGIFAVQIRGDEESDQQVETLARKECEQYAAEPLDFLYDADPAAIRAHALGNFELEVLGDSPGYLTSNREIQSPWLKRFEVLYAGPGDIKRTKAELRKRGLRVFEVKQRGAGLEAESILRQLRMDGEPVSLTAYRIGKSIRFCLLRRVEG